MQHWNEIGLIVWLWFLLQKILFCQKEQFRWKNRFGLKRLLLRENKQTNKQNNPKTIYNCFFFITYTRVRICICTRCDTIIWMVFLTAQRCAYTNEYINMYIQCGVHVRKLHKQSLYRYCLWPRDRSPYVSMLSAPLSPHIFYHHLYLVNVRYIIQWHKKKKKKWYFVWRTMCDSITFRYGFHCLRDGQRRRRHRWC